MGFFSDDSQQAQAYDQYQQTDNFDNHDPSFTHELIAGAAAYEADKSYNNYCDENGRPESHQEAREIMSGFAGAFVDREAETKGLDFLDRERAKRDAQNHLDQIDQNQMGY